MKASLLLFIAVSIFACTPPQQLTNANDAKFIFRATVETIGATTVPEISDPGNCIVVKVNEVVAAPPGFADWTNKSITVAVKQPGKLKPGAEQLFYTNGWLYGKSIAVVELASRNSREFSNQQVLEGVRNNQDKKVQERLKAADLVISGQVIKIGEIIQSKKITEHDPLWTVAIIKVDSVEKGKNPGTELRILFVSSGDVMWEGSPKFREGSKGIWIFRRTNQEINFSVSEKEDFYPIERLEYIRSLLK